MIALFVAACGSDDKPPSCQQALAHFYGAGCMYTNAQTGAVISQMEATSDCQTNAANLSSACLDELDAWLVCNNSVPSPAHSAADCDCSQELMALITCH